MDVHIKQQITEMPNPSFGEGEKWQKKDNTNADVSISKTSVFTNILRFLNIAQQKWFLAVSIALENILAYFLTTSTVQLYEFSQKSEAVLCLNTRRHHIHALSTY